MCSANGGIYLEGIAYAYPIADEVEVNEQEIISNILGEDARLEMANVSNYRLLISEALGYFLVSTAEAKGGSDRYAFGLQGKGSVVYDSGNSQPEEFLNYWGALDYESIRNANAFKYVSRQISSPDSTINIPLITVNRREKGIDGIGYYIVEYSYLGYTSMEVYVGDVEEIRSLALNISYPKTVETFSEDLVDLHIKQTLYMDPELSEQQLELIAREYRESDDYLITLSQYVELHNQTKHRRIITVDHYPIIKELNATAFSEAMQEAIATGELTDCIDE